MYGYIAFAAKDMTEPLKILWKAGGVPKQMPQPRGTYNKPY